MIREAWWHFVIEYEFHERLYTQVETDLENIYENMNRKWNERKLACVFKVE